jgi:hypothetical protein
MCCLGAAVCCACMQSEKASAVQEGQLHQWSRLHWVRTGLSLTSLAVMVATVLRAERSRA